MPIPLDFEGELVFEREGVEALRLDAEGALLRIRFVHLSDAWGVGQRLRLSPPGQASTAELATSAVAGVEVALEILIASHLVARAGPGISGSRLARWFGFGAVDIRPAGLLRAVFAR